MPWLVVTERTQAAAADDHTALVTSANLTGHALTQNMELGFLVRGGSIPKRSQLTSGS
jgi:phosphatidylserine/phosphatidylglycerophosphate/cardiolipin synthase-like enzyme